MEPKKNPKADLRRNSGTYFVIELSICPNSTLLMVSDTCNSKAYVLKVFLALIPVSNKLLKQSFAIAKSGLAYDEKFMSRLA